MINPPPPPQFVCFSFLSTLPEEVDDANQVYKALKVLSAEYQEIAIEFGLSADRVSEIKENYPKDASTVLYYVIVAWVKQEQNVVKFGLPCWRKVVEAAISARNKLVAKKIAREHPGKFRT